MLEALFEAFVDLLQAMPWFRRILLMIILACALWFDVLGLNGFAVWAVVFVGFEIANILLPHKR